MFNGCKSLRKRKKNEQENKFDWTNFDKNIWTNFDSKEYTVKIGYKDHGYNKQIQLHFYGSKWLLFYKNVHGYNNPIFIVP